jgi:hypothetical protein
MMPSATTDGVLDPMDAMTCAEDQQIDSVGGFGAELAASHAHAASIRGWVFDGFVGVRGTVVQAWAYCANFVKSARVVRGGESG